MTPGIGENVHAVQGCTGGCTQVTALVAGKLPDLMCSATPFKSKLSSNGFRRPSCGARASLHTYRHSSWLLARYLLDCAGVVAQHALTEDTATGCAKHHATSEVAVLFKACAVCTSADVPWSQCTVKLDNLSAQRQQPFEHVDWQHSVT